MDSLILCKFLRGVFDDPFPEWAQLLAHRHRLGRRRRRAAGDRAPDRAGQAGVQRARGLDAGGRQAARPLPRRAARDRRPAAAATPHPRPAASHDPGYYEARGLDAVRPARATEQMADLAARARATDRVDAVANSTSGHTDRDQDRQPDDRRSRGHRAGGHDDLAGGQGRRDRDPRAVPRRALRPGRRLPAVRGRRRLARVRRLVRAPVRGRHGGQDRHTRARAQPRPAHRAAARRPAAGGRGPEGDDDRR